MANEDAVRVGALGAVHLGEGRTSFRMWAPRAARVEVSLVAGAGESPRRVALDPEPGGYHHAVVEQAPPGTRYRYVLDGDVERPDPASRLQPEGVHGPSEVVDRQFDWSDAGWRGISREAYVFYELHVATFT